MLLEGLHIPLTMPFHRDGSVNTRALAANVVRYSLTPAAGLIVLGPAGEPTLLNDDETRKVLRTAAEAAAPEKVLIAGVARDSVAAVLDLANFATEQRYDAILVGPPGVLRETQPLELLTFFRSIADRSPLPLILLGTAQHPLLIETVIELAAHRNIPGFLAMHAIAPNEILAKTPTIRHEVTVTNVFAAVTGRMQHTSTASLISPASLTTAIAEAPPSGPALRTRTKSVGFQIISGNSGSLLDALNAGAVGIAPAFAACAPQGCYEVFAGWKDQDQPLASEKQQRIIEAAQTIDSLGPGALKFAADLNGYAGGYPRLPHLPPSGEQRDRIEQLMKPLHN